MHKEMNETGMCSHVCVCVWVAKKFNTKWLSARVCVCVCVLAQTQTMAKSWYNQPSNLASSYRRVYSYQGKIIICHESR